MSLLGQLVPEWRSEEAAARALAYLLDLQHSPGLAKAFVDLLGPAGVPRFELGRVEHDPSSADASRPDLTLCDTDQKPRVFVATIFWEGVDNGQPAAWLGMLPTEAPAALVFVAPRDRISGLWSEFGTRCRDAGIELRDPAVDDDGASARFGDRVLLLVSWMRVLDGLQRVAKEAVEQDVIQLRGLTSRMEKDAFLPLDEREVADVALARRMVGYGNLVEKIAARIVADGIAGYNGKWNAGSCKAGRMANRRMLVRDRFDMRLGVEVERWRDWGVTPLWWTLESSDSGDWQRIKNGIEEVRSCAGSLYIPIRLTTGVDEDRVIRDAGEQTRRLADRLVAVCGASDVVREGDR